jgi:glycosyltransferase involved in cell wall biosynthesis
VSGASWRARDLDSVQKARRRRVLLVTPYLPGAPRFGGQRRLLGVLSALTRAHDVTVLSFFDPEENPTDALTSTRELGARVIALPHRRYSRGGTAKRLWQLAATTSPWSYDRLVHRDQAFQTAFDRLVADGDFDVIQYEFPAMASYGARLTRLGRTRPIQILDEHNIEFDLCRRVAQGSEGLVRKGYGAIESLKLRREEKALWRDLDGCAVTSLRDRDALLSEEPGARAEVVPNGVDLDLFRPADPGLEARKPTLLFFGAVDYAPNTDGLLFFLREVLPLVEKRVPDVRLRIVGRRPPPSIQAFASDRVIVRGIVDDVRAELGAATLVIVPLRMGGGTRLKILESMSMAKAIVSTTLGAEGIDVRHGKELLLADTPIELAGQIVRLIGDRSLCRRLGANARTFVEEHHGWSATIAPLIHLYEEALARRRSLS